MRRMTALTAAAAVMSLALLTVGCTPHLFKAKPPATETFGPMVDAVTVQPFQLGKDVSINAADQKTLRDLLEAEIKAKPGVRVFPKPPTTLPNSASLEPTLLFYQVKEQNGDGLALRTVNLTVAVNARLGSEKEPSIRVQKAVSYQKVYLPGQTIATAEYDVAMAAKELSVILAEALIPSEPVGLTLVRAVDQASGEDWSLPALNKAIGYATDRRDADALRQWALVLFNPEEQGPRIPIPFRDKDPIPPGAQFRVSERTMAWLRDRALDEESLNKLQPMTQLRPLELVPFRDALRKALGASTPLESTVLQLSDYHADHVHLNLYAAHLDLYRMYQRDKRFDVASYHLARAYAHYPMAELLDAWIKLQTDRGLIAAGVQPGMVFFNYLRIPAPRTALVTSGAFELSVLPPPALEDVPDPLPPLVLPARQATDPQSQSPSTRSQRLPPGASPRR